MKPLIGTTLLKPPKVEEVTMENMLNSLIDKNEHKDFKKFRENSSLFNFFKKRPGDFNCR